MVSYFSTINLQAAFHQKEAPSLYPRHLDLLLLFTDDKVLEWKFLEGKCSSVKAPYGAQGTQAMIIIYCLFTVYIPCVITWYTFAHISILFKKSPIARCYGERQRAQQKALLRMCGVTSVVLTLCWLPKQTIYILAPFGITKVEGPLHRTGGMFAMFNACVNPVIYWVTNKEYRDELFELLKLNR